MTNGTIAYVGNFQPRHSTENHLARTLEEDLGWRVVRLQENEVTTDQILTTTLAEGAKLLLYTRTWGTIGDGLALLRTLHERGVPTASYHLDLYWKGNGQFLNSRDEVREGLRSAFWQTKYVFSADGGSQDDFLRAGINHHWIPPGVLRAECYLAEPDERFRADVGFVGGLDHYHEEWLPYRQELKRRLIGWYGDRYQWWPKDQPAIRNEDLNALYASVKVMVGDSLCPGFNHPRYWSDRVPETMGRGGFLIHPRIEGLEDELVDGEHLALFDFNNWDGLKAKIDYYLEHEDARIRIRNAGHEHVKANCTYTNRLRQALDHIAAHEGWCFGPYAEVKAAPVEVVAATPVTTVPLEPVRPYWRNCGYRHGNFGDELVPWILRAIGVPMEPRAAEMHDADLISIGSILSEVPHDYAGAIWGTGAMFHHVQIDLPNANICAVRGRLTANRLRKAPADVALGDPGLLANLIPHEPAEPCWDLAVMPHYADMNDEELGRFLRRNPSAHVIDPCRPVPDVLTDIRRSRALLSSSLHGLVVADALGVPNRWVRLGDRLAGGTFKFRDYYSAFGIDDPIPAVICEGTPVAELIAGARVADQGRVEELRRGLLAAFPGGSRLVTPTSAALVTQPEPIRTNGAIPIHWAFEARGNWDHGMLTLAEEGRLSPFTGRVVTFERAPDCKPGTIVCINGNWIKEQRARDLITSLRHCLVIVHSDEEAQFEPSLLDPSNVLWLQYGRPGIHERAARWVLTGIRAQTPETIRTQAAEVANQPRLRWSFIGQTQHPVRGWFVDAVRPRTDGFLRISSGFGGLGDDGTPYSGYIRTLMRSDFALCPPGNVVADSFRFSEAMECGAIPIVYPRGEREPASHHYWRRVFPGVELPFIVAETPGDILAALNATPVEIAERRARCAAFWSDYKRAFVEDLAATARGLR